MAVCTLYKWLSPVPDSTTLIFEVSSLPVASYVLLAESVCVVVMPPSVVATVCFVIWFNVL